MRKIIIIILSLFLFMQYTYAKSGEFLETYFNYLNNYPSEVEIHWAWNVQGITHDDNYWFITQSKDADDWFDETLWKVPVSHDLSVPLFIHPDTRCVSSIDIPDPELWRYNHFGDLSHYEYEGHNYLVIPLSGNEPFACAIFESIDSPNSLVYKGTGILRDFPSVGWIAINYKGALYFYVVERHQLCSCVLSWPDLADGKILLAAGECVQLCDGAGNPISTPQPQGGVFSESGNILYTVSGYIDGRYPNDGINAFRTSDWRRIKHSSRSQRPFLYYWDYEGTVDQEPEGITIWDLDDGRAPGMYGQLHALVLDNDLNDDDVFIKHYSDKIYVSSAAILGLGLGTKAIPFKMVAEAINLAWSQGGAQIVIAAGNYPETLTINKLVKLTAYGGTAVIGKDTRVKSD